MVLAVTVMQDQLVKIVGNKDTRLSIVKIVKINKQPNAIKRRTKVNNNMSHRHQVTRMSLLNKFIRLTE